MTLTPDEITILRYATMTRGQICGTLDSLIEKKFIFFDRMEVLHITDAGRKALEEAK